MTGELIKSFLVGLGFGVDDASLAKFNQALISATLRVTALYTSVKVMAAGIIYGISKISDGFEQMGYEYKILAPAINKALILRQELFKAYSAAGINIVKTIQASVKLNMSLTKTRYALEAIYRSVGSRFFGLLTKQSDHFREMIYANMPKIQHILENVVRFIFKSLEAVTILGARLWSILQRVYEFFVALDGATGGWSTAILAAIAAWKILNLSFLATPLGMLLAGFAALLTLWDDFKTFKEGGQSLIDWGSQATKTMVGLSAAIAAVAAGILAVNIAMKAYAVIQSIVNTIMLLNPIALMVTGIVALIGLLTVLIFKWEVVKKSFMDFFSGLGGKLLDFISGSNNVATNLQNNPGGVPQGAPIGAGAQNSQTNQNLQQQTNINVMGNADANAVGKAVSSEQSRVNASMARNFKGATR